MAIYLGISNNGTFTTLDGYTLKDANDVILTALPFTSKWKINMDNIAYRVNVNLGLKDGE